MLRTLLQIWSNFLNYANGLSFFFTRVPIDLNGEKIIFSNLIFLVLPFQKVEKGCVPKFGVLIFNLALDIKKWPH